jgi:hypothetical protein
MSQGLGKIVLRGPDTSSHNFRTEESISMRFKILESDYDFHTEKLKPAGDTLVNLFFQTWRPKPEAKHICHKAFINSILRTNS